MLQPEIVLARMKPNKESEIRINNGLLIITIIPISNGVKPIAIISALIAVYLESTVLLLYYSHVYSYFPNEYGMRSYL